MKSLAAPDGMPSARAWSFSFERMDFKVLSSMVNS